MDGQKTARTYTSTDCSHVDQVHLAVEVCQSSVDIIEFKPAVHWYIVLIDDRRSQVGTYDFNMRVPASRGRSPGKIEMRMNIQLQRGAYQMPLPHPEIRKEANVSKAYKG